VRQGVVWFEHAGLADAGKRASTVSVGGADGAAALHMHEAGGEGAGGRVKSFLVSLMATHDEDLPTTGDG
jgi:hypothetical protein